MSGNSSPVPTHPASRPRGTRAEISTAVAGFAALTVATAALIVGWQTLEEQQKINESQLSINENQLEINRIQMDRNDRRFASRVSWWRVPFDEEDPRNSKVMQMLKLQNRSPVPLTEISFQVEGQSDEPVVYVIDDDVPPCHILTFKIVAPTADGAEFGRGQFSLGDRDQIRLYFSDTQGFWLRDLAGVRRVDQPEQTEDAGTGIEKVEGGDREVEDCGEGG